MKNRVYEEPKIELIQLQSDIITASVPSDPFLGEDDELTINP